MNDDGPPGPRSPFIAPFVSKLQERGHKVTVVLPHIQRSWIGKAHLPDEHLEQTYYFPDRKETSDKPRDDDGEQWNLLSGLPASCAMVGLEHHAKDIDAVISGPNLGRNSTRVFAMSSGTMGGAMEASLVCYRLFLFSKTEQLFRNHKMLGKD